jgi:hypothetical protein
MTGEKVKENHMEFLRGQGFFPTLDDDGDICFPFEGRSYHLIVDEDDPEYFQLARVNIWSIDSEEERVKAEAVTLDLNGRIKCAKLYVTEDDVWVTCELFCNPIEDCQSVFRRALTVVQLGTRMFREAMRSETPVS